MRPSFFTGPEGSLCWKNMKLDQKLDKEEYKKRKDALSMRLGELQRACKDAGIPVMFVFEASALRERAPQINELIYGLDPRGFQVYAPGKPTEEEALPPISVAVLDKDAAAGADRGFLITAGMSGC